MMTAKRNLIGLALLSVLFGASAFAGIYDELTDAQKAAIDKGEQVFVMEEVQGSAWPKAFVYQTIEATPEEAAAVYTDYELQKAYVPNVKKCKISKRHDRKTVEIDYTIAIPVLSDEDYTVKVWHDSYDEGKSFRVDWTLLRADTTKSSVGNMRFEAHGGGTILAYYNFVVPGSGLAGIVKKKAMKQVRDTTQAIVNQIEKERKEQPDLLSKQIESLRESLRSSF